MNSNQISDSKLNLRVAQSAQVLVNVTNSLTVTGAAIADTATSVSARNASGLSASAVYESHPEYVDAVSGVGLDCGD